MNAAEITDKLGLHSLRQRAWVSTYLMNLRILLILPSTFNPPVLPPEMVFMKVWSGSQALFERLVISKFGVIYYPSIRLCFPRMPLEQSKRPYSQPLLHIDHWCSISSTILVSSSGPLP